MTVHGSKGLQAPIVFLPDTVKKLHDHNKGRVRLIWPEDETGVPLWSPRQEFDAPVYEALQGAARERQEEEYRRLLYVALTRAEDRLYICGYHGIRAPRPDCWYNLVSGAFPARAEKIEAGADDDGVVQYIRRLEHLQEAPPEKEKHHQKKPDVARLPLPSWAQVEPAEEPFPSQPLAPSKPGEDEPAAKGPLAGDDGVKFRRGVIVHQILEFLPQLPPEKWEQSLAKYLARPALGIPSKQQKELAAEVLAVLRHPDFAPIFGAGSRAEVPVTAQLSDKVISGQMDRIRVTDNEVLIIDYKTNRPPPNRVEDVPVVYLKQMAAYKAIMNNIYKNHVVKCALLWTDGPLLMVLSDKILDYHMP
jgi:ATP-dependent helicase/nuclease subunit A